MSVCVLEIHAFKNNYKSSLSSLYVLAIITDSLDLPKINIFMNNLVFHFPNMSQFCYVGCVVCILWENPKTKKGIAYRMSMDR